MDYFTLVNDVIIAEFKKERIGQWLRGLEIINNLVVN